MTAKDLLERHHPTGRYRVGTDGRKRIGMGGRIQIGIPGRINRNPHKEEDDDDNSENKHKKNNEEEENRGNGWKRKESARRRLFGIPGDSSIHTAITAMIAKDWKAACQAIGVMSETCIKIAYEDGKVIGVRDPASTNFVTGEVAVARKKEWEIEHNDAAATNPQNAGGEAEKDKDSCDNSDGYQDRASPDGWSDGSSVCDTYCQESSMPNAARPACGDGGTPSPGAGGAGTIEEEINIDFDDPLPNDNENREWIARYTSWLEAEGLM